MDTWWIKFNLKLLFLELLSHIPLFSIIPVSSIKDFRYTYNLIKGQSDWIAEISAPTVFVFENLDYLLQVPITLDDIMFENKYPPELKLYLKRLLELMTNFGYVKKLDRDTYVLQKPISLTFTSEYQIFAEHELKKTPSGREHSLLHDIYSWQKRFKSGYNLSIRRLRSIPNLYTFVNFILPYIRELTPKTIGFAGGYVISLIPLVNYFSTNKIIYFGDNALISNKLQKLVQSVSPKAYARVNFSKNNIFRDVLNVKQKHFVDVMFLSSIFILEYEIFLDVLVKNLTNLLSDKGIIVIDDFILFSDRGNPYLLASKESPFFYHYLTYKDIVEEFKKNGFSKIKFFFPNRKIGAYRGCVIRK